MNEKYITLHNLQKVHDIWKIQIWIKKGPLHFPFTVSSHLWFLNYFAVFEAFKEDKVKYNWELIITILAIWSSSLLQFCLVLTATKSKKGRAGFHHKVYTFILDELKESRRSEREQSVFSGQCSLLQNRAFTGESIDLYSWRCTVLVDSYLNWLETNGCKLCCLTRIQSFFLCASEQKNPLFSTELTKKNLLSPTSWKKTEKSITWW